jgi:adenine-specific DNA-methyltransferase
MRYIGSKTSTLPRLTDVVTAIAPHARSLCDPFAGTCSVSRHFKHLGFRVSTGDLLATSYAIQIASVGLNRYPAFRALISSGEHFCSLGTSYARVLSHLTSLVGRHGFITEQFSPAGGAGRFFFTVENAKRIDAIRETIRRWSSWKLLSKNEEALLLATLIVNADKVANTAGTYYAYLKHTSRKAAKSLVLDPIPVRNNNMNNDCTQADASDVAASSDADILYLDPPYNRRDYAGYYHLPETIILGEEPELVGMSGVPKSRRTPLSDFCIPSRATYAFERLVLRSQSKHIIVHYTPSGLIAHRDILAILASLGNPYFKDIRVRRYSAHSNGRSIRTTHRIYWCNRGR